MATFTEALNYAKQNPDSEFANEFRRRIESGQLNEDAKKEGIDLGIRTSANRYEIGSGSNFGQNLINSVANFAGSTAYAVAHPIETTKTLGKMAIGGLEKLVPGRQEYEENFDALTDFFKNRYGSIDSILKTAYTDPVGFVTDLSVVLGGVSKVGKFAGISKVGEASKVGEVAKAGEVIREIPKPNIAPFAKSVDAEAVKAATRQGVELPASAMSKSPSVGVIESLGAKGMFGSSLVKKVENVVARMNKVAEDTIASASKATDLTGTGESIIKGFADYKKSFIETKNALYDAAELPATNAPKAKQIVVNTNRTQSLTGDTIQSTIQLLDSAIKESKLALKGTGIKSSQEVSFMEGIKKSLEKNYLPAKEIRAKLKLVADKAEWNSPFATGTKGLLRKVWGSLSEDLDVAIRTARPDLAKALDSANAFYKEGITRLNSTYGKAVKRMVGQPDKIVEALFKPSMSLEDIAKIKEIIGTEAMSKVRASLLEKIFDKARGVSGEFTPGGFSRILKSFGEDKLSAIFTKEQIGVLKDLDTLSQSLGRSSKILSGSQTAFITRIGAELLTLGVYPLKALKLVMGDAAFTKFISSDVGKKFLTDGLFVNFDKILQRSKLTGQVLYESGQQAKEQ